MLDLEMKSSGYQNILRFCTHFNAYKRHSDIHSDEIDALLYISTNPQAITPHKLADYFNVSKPRITKVINKLLEQQYIEKRVSLKDSRSQTLHLTSLGIKKLSAIQKDCYKIIDRLVDELGFGDYIQLVELLNRANQLL